MLSWVSAACLHAMIETLFPLLIMEMETTMCEGNCVREHLQVYFSNEFDDNYADLLYFLPIAVGTDIGIKIWWSLVTLEVPPLKDIACNPQLQISSLSIIHGK